MGSSSANVSFLAIYTALNRGFFRDEGSHTRRGYNLLHTQAVICQFLDEQERTHL